MTSQRLWGCRPVGELQEGGSDRHLLHQPHLCRFLAARIRRERGVRSTADGRTEGRSPLFIGSSFQLRQAPTQTRLTRCPTNTELPDGIDWRVAEADHRQRVRQPQILSHFLKESCASVVWGSPGRLFWAALERRGARWTNGRSCYLLLPLAIQAS